MSTNATHTFTHEIRWHWVIVGFGLVAVAWELSDSTLVEETDATTEDAARLAGQLMTN
jgi:hypothetical protein